MADTENGWKDHAQLLTVVTLGVLAVISLVGMVWISIVRDSVPPALSAVAGTCIGTLSGVLMTARNPNGINKKNE